MIVLTVGCFDLLHEGHADLFKKMREQGDRVVVIVHNDKSIYENKGKFPVQNLEQRMNNIILTDLVDEVHPVATADPTPTLEEYYNKHPEFVYMRGDDWGDFPGKPFLDEKGIPIKFKSYTEGVSSSKLRDEL